MAPHEHSGLKFVYDLLILIDCNLLSNLSFHFTNATANKVINNWEFIAHSGVGSL